SHEHVPLRSCAQRVDQRISRRITRLEIGSHGYLRELRVRRRKPSERDGQWASAAGITSQIRGVKSIARRPGENAGGPAINERREAEIDRDAALEAGIRTPARLEPPTTPGAARPCADDQFLMEGRLITYYACRPL